MSDSLFTAGLLRRSARAFAKAALLQVGQQRPELLDRGLPSTFADPAADLEVRVLQLAEAVAVEAPELFGDAAGWYRVAFAHRGVPDDYLLSSFEALGEVLRQELPLRSRPLVAACLTVALDVARHAPTELPSELQADAPHVDLARRFLLAVLENRTDDALDLVRAALDRGVPIPELHDHVLAKVQREVGRMWLMTEIPIADEHLSTVIVGQALHAIQERLPRPPRSTSRIVCFSVGGNLHDLGLRLVAQRLQLAGFAVTNLGGNMPADDLEWAIRDRQPDLVAMSASMLLHLGAAAATTAGLRRSLGSNRPRILAGGQPFSRVADLHERIGADAGAGDAEAAVAAARRLLGAGAV